MHGVKTGSDSLMYLENPEQCSAASVEEERPAKVMLTEQYHLPQKNLKVEDLSSSSKRSAEPVKDDFDDQIVLGGEIKACECSSESCGAEEEDPESICCDESFESFEPSSIVDGRGFCESDQIVDQFETAGLSRPFDAQAQHCECFEPCKSPEHRANHSLTSECDPCCEHCTEHLRSFQQCKLSNQQCDPGPEEVAACYSASGRRCEIPDFIYVKCSERLEAQQHEPLDQQDGFCDSEAEDCEVFETTATVSESEDYSDCDTRLCEDDQMPYQSECSDDEGSELPEECEAFEKESGTMSPTQSDDPPHFYLDESQDVSLAMECCEVYPDNYHAADVSSDQDEESETHSDIQQDFETTELCSSSERTSDFFSEEDGSSDCSSVETKSFKTCLGSVPSNPCSDSSEESDKGAQEDSGDEQARWESFDEDDELQQSGPEGLNEDRKKTPIVDIIIEDFFDLFDRDDYYGRAFTPKRQYVSCFDGGDIHARLFLEEINSELQKVDKNAHVHKEIDEDSCLCDAPDQAGEDTNVEHQESPRDETTFDSVSELESKPSDWIIESESNSAADEGESDEAEDEEDLESSDHEADDCGRPQGRRERMCPPFANDISVEGDAYEDQLSEPGCESFCKSNSALSGFQLTFLPDSESESAGDSEDDEFLMCSEAEPYWLPASHHDAVGLVEEPYVEEYYAYQIRSIETAVKQASRGIMKKECSYGQTCERKADDEICWSKADGAILSLEQSESQADDVGEQQQQQSSVDLNSDRGGREPAGERTPPSGIIHSVLSEEADEAPEQSQEEEESDDESCDCEYCVPAVEQVFECVCWVLVSAQQG